PYFSDDPFIKRLNGYYRHLNRRLESLCQQNAEATRDLFEVVEINSQPPRADAAPNFTRLDRWNPTSELLDDVRDNELQSTFDHERARHAPLIISSYTSLQSARESLLRTEPSRSATGFDPEDFKAGVDVAETSGVVSQLPGGRNVGLFLHEAIEEL